MAYSSNILSDDASYYSSHRAQIDKGEITFQADGYVECDIPKTALTQLTSKMLIVLHAETYSTAYCNDSIQIELQLVLPENKTLFYNISASDDGTGIYNAEVNFPESDFIEFKYRIFSHVPNKVYNWEICPEASADMSEVIDGVKQAVPKLLYDYNTYAYAIAQVETTIGMIACFLREPTDLQGHFTLSFFATERCNVHVRIKDNEITELFSPQVYTVDKGYASISIPHAYLHKTASSHSFTVTVQCTNGQLSIPVRGMLYTIDGGHLVTRLLDAGINIRDISIRQLNNEKSPSEIWAIGFDGKRLLVKKREYSLSSKVNWKGIKDFGEMLDGCIEFNGTWAYKEKSDKVTLHTDQTPFIFILTPEHKLLVYTDAQEEPYELATNVTSAAACRGYSSMYRSKDDQGLTVCYIVDQKVYYRQYLYDEATDAYMWFKQEILSEDPGATFVSLHRLPDYRFGVCISYVDDTKWYISERTWVGQGVKQESARISITNKPFFTVIDYNMMPDFSIEGVPCTIAEGPSFFDTFYVTFRYPLTFLHDGNIEDLKKHIVTTVRGSKYDDKGIAEIKIEGNALTWRYAEKIRGSSIVTVKLDYMYLGLQLLNGFKTRIGTPEYTWTLPIPTIRESVTEPEVHLSVENTPILKNTGIRITLLQPNKNLDVSITENTRLTNTKVSEHLLLLTPSVFVKMNTKTIMTNKQVGEIPV